MVSNTVQYGFMNRPLGQSRYLAGNDYTIAGLYTYPWVQQKIYKYIVLKDEFNAKQWYDELPGCPAVKKGVVVLFYNGLSTCKGACVSLCNCKI
jgi:GST-like protein